MKIFFNKNKNKRNRRSKSKKTIFITRKVSPEKSEYSIVWQQYSPESELGKHLSAWDYFERWIEERSWEESEDRRRRTEVGRKRHLTALANLSA